MKTGAQGVGLINTVYHRKDFSCARDSLTDSIAIPIITYEPPTVDHHSKYGANREDSADRMSEVGWNGSGFTELRHDSKQTLGCWVDDGLGMWSRLDQHVPVVRMQAMTPICNAGLDAGAPAS